MCCRLLRLAGEAVGPDRWGVERLRLFDRHDGIERPIVDRNRLRRVRGRRLVLRENERHRVADEDRPLARQKQRRPVVRRQRGKVGGGDDRGHPRQRLGGGGVDAQHLGVGMRARDQAGVEEPGPVEVAAETERTLDLGRAFEELGGGADRCHVLSPPWGKVSRGPLLE